MQNLADIRIAQEEDIHYGAPLPALPAADPGPNGIEIENHVRIEEENRVPFEHHVRIERSVAHHQEGIAILHDCENATVDICFVHGLAGDMFETWTAARHRDPWPKALLPAFLPDARILTFGYNVYGLRENPSLLVNLIRRSVVLLEDLAGEREDTATLARPLILVAHSLGGLVCKEAVLLSQHHTEPQLRDLFESLQGIVFMGTPHHGDWLANAAGVPATSLGFSASLRGDIEAVLAPQSQLLESLRQRFADMLRDLGQNGSRRIEIVSFYEEIAMAAGWPMVVSAKSAIFDEYTCLSIPANHRDMVKFASKDDLGFKRLRRILKRWSAESKSIIIKQAPTSQSPLSSPSTSDLNVLLSSLSFADEDMIKRHQNLDEAVQGTCTWLLKDNQYRSWASSVSHVLWVLGIPGSGKSTLLQCAVRQHSKTPDLVLSYRFYGTSQGLGNTVLEFLRAITYQILEQVHNTADLTGIYQRRHHHVLPGPAQEWAWEEDDLKEYIRNTLFKVLATRSVWLFVDALDELGADAFALRDWLEDLRAYYFTTTSPGSRFVCRFCISSRHYPALALENAYTFRIYVEDGNGADIAMLVDHRLREYPDILSSDIPQLITEHALGVFAWTDWVISRILSQHGTGVSLEAMRETVLCPSNALDMLYDRYMATMQSNPDCLELMQWACFSEKRLSPDALRWAMAVSPDEEHPSLKVYVETATVMSRDAMEAEILRLSCGLLELQHETETDSSTVDFVHPTARAFMLNRGLPGLHGGTMTAEGIRTTAHAHLARKCARFAVLGEMAPWRALAQRGGIEPFAIYADACWNSHVKGCDGPTDNHARIQEDLLRLLMRCPIGNFPTWFQAHSHFPLLDFLAMKKLWGLLKALLSENDLRTRRKTGWKLRRSSYDVWAGSAALHMAAHAGNREMVHLMLEDGADVNALTDVQYFMHFYDANTFRIMDIYAHPQWDRMEMWTLCTPLFLAAGQGHVEIVQLLLRKDADVNLGIPNGPSPVYFAMQTGQETAAFVLKQHGADATKPNNVDKWHWQ